MQAAEGSQARRPVHDRDGDQNALYRSRLNAGATAPFTLASNCIRDPGTAFRSRCSGSCPRSKVGRTALRQTGLVTPYASREILRRPNAKIPGMCAMAAR